MKQLIILAVSLLLAVTGHTAAEDNPDIPKATDSGNGGGGIHRDGNYMTFYSAGFYIEPTEINDEEIPQLNEMVTFFNDVSILSEKTKIKYLQALMPSSKRQYYKVKPDTFTEEVKQSVLKAYAETLNLPIEEVVIFAITHEGTTYFFPEYFELSDIEQKTVLYHEASWVVNPEDTYKAIIDKEILFQAYLEEPNNPKRVVGFSKSIGTNTDILISAINYDLGNDYLEGITHYDGGQKIQLKILLGDKWFNCVLESSATSEDCYGHVQSNLYFLKQKHNRSVLLEMLYESAVNKKLFVGYNGRSAYNFLADKTGNCSSTKNVAKTKLGSLKLNLSANHKYSNTTTIIYTDYKVYDCYRERDASAFLMF